jgi:hypothetical protein
VIFVTTRIATKGGRVYWTTDVSEGEDEEGGDFVDFIFIRFLFRSLKRKY